MIVVLVTLLAITAQVKGACVPACHSTLATCISEGSRERCQCNVNAGYGTGLATDGINACRTTPCGSSSTCHRDEVCLDGTCTCKANFACDAFNCPASDCGANSYCNIFNGWKRCNCLPSYVGDPYTGCSSQATCNPTCNSLTSDCVLNFNNQPVCQCKSGFSLSSSGQCVTTTCNPTCNTFNENCVLTSSGAICQCKTGYTRNSNGNCQVTCNPTCNVFTSDCILSSQNQPFCQCKSGFAFDSSGQCVSTSCSPSCNSISENCVFISTGPICQCKPGYSSSNGVCQQNCPQCDSVTEVCIQQGLTSQCVCAQGFTEHTLFGTCISTQCVPSCNSVTEDCNMVNNQPTCQCKPGFLPNSFGQCTSTCFPVCSAFISDCVTDSTGQSKCVCKPGYSKDQFGNCVSWCSGDCHQDLAHCVYVNEVAACRCNTGQGYGDGLAASGAAACTNQMCEGIVDEVCHRDAECVFEFNKHHCRCKNDFACHFFCRPEKKCGIEASCDVEQGIEVCKCQSGFEGDPLVRCTHKCDLKGCEESSSFCELNENNEAICTCKEGYQKAANGDCVDVNECLTAGWCRGENTYCLNFVGGYTCECSPQYKLGENSPEFGRDRTCPDHDACTMGKVCTCANVQQYTISPQYNSFVATANPEHVQTALMHVAVWSHDNVMHYCKMAQCHDAMLVSTSQNMTEYIDSVESFLQNVEDSRITLRDIINCNSNAGLEVAMWSLYEQFGTNQIMLREALNDLKHKRQMIEDERERCKEDNLGWFRSNMEDWMKVKY